MRKLKKIYAKFNIYQNEKSVKRNIDFCFILNQDFWKGFSDLTEKEGGFDWFNNRCILNKYLSLNKPMLVCEKQKNLKKYHSIYNIEKSKDIEDILNFFEKPKGLLTVRPIFYFKGNKIKSINFLLFPLEGSLLEDQLKARKSDFDSIISGLSKTEKVETFIWQKMDREGLHVKGDAVLDCIFNLNDPNQVKKLFNAEFWLKHARKSLNAWRKK